jgi:predicted nucleic acid-binding protein
VVREEPQAAREVKLVVDTNIVFSAVLNSNSRIARILIAGKRHFEFHSCAFLHEELLKHRPKLKSLTGLSGKELDEVIEKVTANIRFVDETTLSARLVLDTERKLASTDVKDVPFVALARRLRARLWTGDKALVRGLEPSHPKLAITTVDLWLMMEELEH